MATIEHLRKIAVALPEVTEEPHFEKISFRVKKKIFITYDPDKKWASAKLSVIDQDIFSKASKGSIYAVENKWGLQGWTIIELSKVNKSLFTDIIKAAYCVVAPPKLAKLVRGEEKDLEF